MAYPVDGWHEELIADHGQGDEEVEREERMQHDGAMLPLQLREQAGGEVVDGRRRAVTQVHIWKQQNDNHSNRGLDSSPRLL